MLAEIIVRVNRNTDSDYIAMIAIIGTLALVAGILAILTHKDNR